MAAGKKPSVGDTFTCTCGTIVTVVSYVNANCVIVEDRCGNRRVSDSYTLRKGIKWLNKDGSLATVKAQTTDRFAKVPYQRCKSRVSMPAGHYVYMTTLKGEIVYVGYGKGLRFMHTISGRSSSKELNRLYFANEPLITEVVIDDLSQEEASNIEKQMLDKHRPRCNEKFYNL